MDFGNDCTYELDELLNELRDRHILTQLNGDLTGEGIFDDIIDRIKHVIYGKKSLDTEKALKDLKGYYITEYKIHRTPVESVLKKVLNLISLGNFNKYKEKYDDIYHLFMVIKLENAEGNEKYYLTEKAPNIIFKKVKNLDPRKVKVEDTYYNKLDIPVSFADVIEMTKETMGEKFATYSNPLNNCQVWIMNLIASMYKLMNAEIVPKKIVDFVLQDVEDIVSGTTRNVANFVTELGHAFGRLMGHGLIDPTL